VLRVASSIGGDGKWLGRQIVDEWSQLGEKWCAIQGSNLQQTSKSLGNSDAASQIASQEQWQALQSLDLIVDSWPKLSAPLKAAILAIVDSTKDSR